MFGSGPFLTAGRRFLRTTANRRVADTGHQPLQRMPEPMELAVRLIADCLALEILGALIAGPLQLCELIAELPGIGEDALAASLEALEKAGLVERRMLSPLPSIDVYETTDFASEPVLEALSRWALEP